MPPRTARRIAVLAAFLFVSGAAQLAPAAAEDPSTGEIVDALQPKVKFRAFDPAQAERESRQSDLVNHLQREKTRQITVEERQEIAEVVEENDLPAIDLEVFFAFDSAEITPEALPILKKLGAALSDDKLKGSVFRFPIEQFDIDPKQLVAIGFGEEQLKNKEDPRAAENRRVQVVNIASKDVAATPGANE